MSLYRFTTRRSHSSSKRSRAYAHKPLPIGRRAWLTTVLNETHSLALEQLLAVLDDPRIVYRRVPNGGAAAARNVGLAATNSRYITLLDSDDAIFRICCKRI